MRHFQYSVMFIALAGMTACSVGPAYKQPKIELTPVYMGSRALVPRETPEAWWHAFNDPALDQVEALALANNMDLAQVRARILQARAALKYAQANLLPSANVSGAASRNQSSLASPTGAIAHAVGAARENNEYSLGGEASWEVDLFGGLRHSRDASVADARAVKVSADALRVSIAAEVADAYISLRELQSSLALVQQQIQIQNDFTQLMKQRYSKGVSSDSDVQRVIALLASLKANEAPLHIAIDGQLNRLDILMGAQAGTYRTMLLSNSGLPVAPAPSGSIQPADLLRQRPDIVAAEQQLIAANARVGASIAEYYPHFSLSAALGVASLGTSNLFTQSAAERQGLLGLRWRLFDFGRIDAEVARAKGQEAEALAVYRGTALKATEDVENSLSQYVGSGEEVLARQGQLKAQTRARDQTLASFRDGIVAKLDVLEADRDLLGVQDSLNHANAQKAKAAVSIYRALGGGWRG